MMDNLNILSAIKEMIVRELILHLKTIIDKLDLLKKTSVIQ